ncbi:MAG: di-trans,poly-cis-decaprenylcistransferase, partial [Prevotella sp.]|nr:di-trans,poly-cis-decaprenylcistransferase [Prevotella sp.]
MKELLDMNRIPQHIAIIMDGNGRWAMDRGLDRTFGHKAGLDNLETITTVCSNLGVKYLTVYAFSIENFNRPAYEVEALMGLVLSFFKMQLFHNNNVSFHVVGDIDRLPESVQKKLRSMVEETAMYDGMAMTIAMPYSAKQELVNTTKVIAQKVKSGEIGIDDITEETIAKNLWTNWMPDPDLLIRTGGEVRISNYLLW